MICIIGVGLLLSFRTGFIQIRKFPYAMKVTLGRMLKKREASDGALTPFQAVYSPLASLNTATDGIPLFENSFAISLACSLEQQKPSACLEPYLQ